MFLPILQNAPAVCVLHRLSLSLSLLTPFKLDKVRQLSEREGPQSEGPVGVSLSFSLLLVSVFDRGW